MSQETISRIEDTVKWYEEHKNDGRSVDNEVSFLKKTVDCMLECIIRQQQDIRELEGKPKADLGRKIWTPGPMRVRGDLRRFG